MQPPICFLRHSLKMQLQFHTVTSWSPPDFLQGERSKDRQSRVAVSGLGDGVRTRSVQATSRTCLPTVSPPQTWP